MKSKDFTNWNDYNEYSFGRFVAQRREELGLSARQLSALVGMSPVYLCDIERGHRKAPENYMSAFVTHLKISPEELDNFYIMAYATNGKYFEFKEYLNENYYARTFLRIAKNKNLSEEEWQKIIEQIKG